MVYEEKSGYSGTSPAGPSSFSFHFPIMLHHIFHS